MRTRILTIAFCLMVGGVTNAASNLFINEIMPANIDVFVDPSWNYGGFIELYNSSSSTISLSKYYLSDDPDNLKKWQMPEDMGTIASKGFFTIWFDHSDQYCNTQANFKLDVNGGTIYLTNRYGVLVASQEYPAAFRRCSYARKTDGGNEWSWTGDATPGKSNNSSAFATEQLPLPVVNKEGRVFSGTLQLVVNIPAGTTLRYTSDGSLPTLTNGYTSNTGIFAVSSSTAYRFRYFKNGYLPSDVKTCSYISKDYDFCAPIISVVTDDKNINGRDYGIFVAGNGNGRSGRGRSDKCNWNMDWDRPVSFEYIPDGDESVFSQEVNMSAVGGWSRAWTPHSFKLKANKQYGINYMPYCFFDNKPFNKNKTLQIRNGGNDNGCRIIDPAIQTIIARSGIDVDCQSYKPVFVYINGKIYNVLNMREPNNKHFAFANKGYDDDELDQFEYSPDSAYVQMAGTRDAFEQWYDLSANAADDEVYEQIKQLVDIDEFINYFAVEMYIGCGDWINNSNNLKGYRPAVEGGKFRFVVFDTDSYGGTSQFSSVENTNWQTLDYIYDIGGSLYKEIEITTIWLNMLQNEQFRKQFADAFCLVAGSVFEPTRCKTIITELANHAYDVMHQVGGNSPWGSANNLISTFSSSRQKSMVNTMKKYSRLQMSSATSITADISTDVEGGKLLVNNQPVPTNKFSGTLLLPITLRAEAPGGYKFAGWKTGTSTTETPIFENGSEWSYYDQGSLDGKGWTSASYFELSSWKTGKAPLGYATGTTWSGFNTTLDYGGDKNNKRSTYYFRKEVQLSEKPSVNDSFTLYATLDDGCIVYVNGTEVGRFNMPSGTVSYSTYSSTYGDQFDYPQAISIDPTLFKKGNNLIAVEVHNNNASSTDIYWDASLMTTMTSEPEEESYLSTDPELELTRSISAVACFEPLSAEELIMQGGTPVKVNEVSAGNSIYVNEFYKKEDWVELYNTTSETIDLAGMYLSDNVNKPQKYQFAAGSISTVIEPFGYRVVWCDKKDAESQLHASFKLGNENGSYVILTAEDNSWADTLQYDAHNGDMSVGRYPDGSKNIYAMYNPTIGKSNTLTSYDTIHYEIRPTPGPVDGIYDTPLIAREGGMSITFSNGYILVKNEECLPTNLYIYSPSGQLLVDTQLNLSSGHTSYSVSLPQGIYVAKVCDSSNNNCATKFVIK